jgi:hypothetical protein
MGDVKLKILRFKQAVVEGDFEKEDKLRQNLEKALKISGWTRNS